ncbi:hypothetical protein BY996DRAFT_6501595 [Phakopsora pachyrhizi]|nr:hypothetical protein BY996DRAFT_6501595 [Phakopsora pachyrhizi]
MSIINKTLKPSGQSSVTSHNQPAEPIWIWYLVQEGFFIGLGVTTVDEMAVR